MSQWKQQLRNRKQKPGETVEEYAATLEELWKRIDPHNRRMELDRISEFIEGLRAELIIPVQSAMPKSINDAIDKAKAVETAYSIRMELSAYSMLSGYLNNMNGVTVPARSNAAIYQPAYTAAQTYSNESMEQMLSKKIEEGIRAAMGQYKQGRSN